MQFDIVNASIKKIIVHKVGTQENETSQTATYSKECIRFEQDSVVPGLLKQYFLSPFNDPNLYNLSKENILDEKNLVYSSISDIFNNEDTFLEQSRILADYLAKSSSNSNIKSGEFYLVLFENMSIFNQEVNCIGLFKSETKETFLRIQPSGDDIDIKCEEGINIKKLDKGCLVFNTEKENGFIATVVDKTSRVGEAAFWKTTFLNLLPREDNTFDTNNYLNACKEFVNQVYSPINNIPRENQIDMKSKTFNYFKDNDTFIEDDFKKNILREDDIIREFDDYKRNYQTENSTQLKPSFDISNDVVKREKSKFRSVIKLDKNFHIYVHGNETLLQKGFDTEKGLNYYKIFFENES